VNSFVDGPSDLPFPYSTEFGFSIHSSLQAFKTEGVHLMSHYSTIHTFVIPVRPLDAFLASFIVPYEHIIQIVDGIPKVVLIWRRACAGLPLKSP